MKKQNLKLLVVNKHSISCLKFKIYGGIDKDNIKPPRKTQILGCSD